jgi:hypothetical protein
LIEREPLAIVQALALIVTECLFVEVAKKDEMIGAQIFPRNAARQNRPKIPKPSRRAAVRK